MDVFERVREVNAGASLTTEQISGARSRLLEGIDAGTAAARKRISRRPMFLIAGAVAGVAAATATVVVVSQLTAPAPQVEAVPAPPIDPRQPGEVIPHPGPTSGTGVTEPFPGTTPQAGQYLQISRRFETLLYRGPDPEVYQWLARHEDDTRLPISALLVEDQHVLYVPGDRSSVWVSVRGPADQRLQAYPSPQPVGDIAAWENLLPPDPETTVTEGLAGVIDGFELDEDYSAYPKDPQLLLDHLWAFFSEAGESRHDSVMESLLSVLRSNTAPAEVRQVFLEALQLSDRSSVDAVAGDVTTYGVVFDSVDARRETISIDARTGWATEYTVTFQRDDGGLVPPSVPDLRVVASVSIVNAIP